MAQQLVDYLMANKQKVWGAMKGEHKVIILRIHESWDQPIINAIDALPQNSPLFLGQLILDVVGEDGDLFSPRVVPIPFVPDPEPVPMAPAPLPELVSEEGSQPDTEVEIPNQAEPLNKRKSVRQSLKDTRDRIKAFPWRKFFTISAIIVAIVVVLVGFTSLKNAGIFTPQPNTEFASTSPSPQDQGLTGSEGLIPFDQNTLTKVDPKSVGGFGTTQRLFLLALIGVIFFGYLDRKEHLQLEDAIAALVCFGLNYLLTWAPVVSFFVTLVGENQRAVMLIVSGVLITYVMSRVTGGGRDTTALGMYLGSIVLFGIIVRTLGALQIVFKLQEQPLYLLPGVISALQSMQYEAVKFSVIVYMLLFGAIGSYALDIVYPKTRKVRWEAVTPFITLVVLYYLFKYGLIAIGLPLYEVELALVIATAVAIGVAVALRKSDEGNVAGENQLSKVVKRVFDFIGWDGITLGLLTVTLLRLCGYA